MTLLELTLGFGLVAIAIIGAYASFLGARGQRQLSSPSDERAERENLKRKVVSERRQIISDIEREREAPRSSR